MLKFGRVVNLEQLENVTVNKLAEELQRKIKQQEKSANKELSQIKVCCYHKPQWKGFIWFLIKALITPHTIIFYHKATLNTLVLVK